MEALVHYILWIVVQMFIVVINMQCHNRGTLQQKVNIEYIIYHLK